MAVSLPPATGAMEVLCGVLSVKHAAVLKHKTLDKHWCVLFHGVKTLSPRIDIYAKDPHLGKASCKKTIYIESASWKKIDSIEPAFSFEVKQSKQYIFYCNSTAERREWLLSLCCISEGLFDTKHVVGVSNDGTINASSVPGDEYSVVIQNDVYGGASEVQTFFVLADQSDGCLNFQWKGIFKLVIGMGSMRLVDPSSNGIVVEWMITELRSYGSSTYTMFVRAGKRSTTGEGKFTFRTTESAKIIGIIGRETQIIQNNKNEAVASSPIPVGKMYPQVLPEHSASEVNGLKHKAPVPLPSASEGGQMYGNIGAEGSPGSQSGKDTRANGKDFMKQLEVRSAGLVERKESVETTLSNGSSGNKKDHKKAMKELKKKEEEEKKLRKKQEKLERKKEEERKREERHMMRKNGGRPPKKPPGYNTLIPPEPENVYAEADELGDLVGTQSTFNADGQAVGSPLEENTYAEAGDFPVRPAPPPHEKKDVRETQIYNEPWGKNPILPSMEPQADEENIYAEPEKKNGTRPKVAPEDDEYVDTESLASGGPPPDIIPPVWEQEGSSNDSNSNNPYAHINEAPTPAPYEHVYGIGSASAEFSPGNSVETASAGAGEYESFGM